MSDIRLGLIIVNTGPGKGKTMAAIGTGLRAAGQGLVDIADPVTETLQLAHADERRLSTDIG